MTAWCRMLGDAGPLVAVRRGGQLSPVRAGGQPLTDLHPIIRGELAAADLTFGEPIALAEVRLLAPIGSFPRNIFCIGKNYREHALEFTTSGFDSSGGAAPTDVIPTSPIVFSKPFTSVIGPGDLIERHPDLTSMLDYEAELAVVIGRGGRDIAHHDALDHVFGYTIVNDVTARDRQQQHRQWLLGKGMDTFCPMGPAVVADTGPLRRNDPGTRRRDRHGNARRRGHRLRPAALPEIGRRGGGNHRTHRNPHEQDWMNHGHRFSRPRKQARLGRGVR